MSHSSDFPGVSRIPHIGTGSGDFRAAPGTIDLTGPVIGLKMQLDELARTSADHEGQLKGVSVAVTGVLSALSSWVTVALGIGSLAVAVLGIFAVYQVYNNQRMDTKVDALETKIETTTARIETLTSEVRALPAALSREMLAVARDIATIARPAPPPQQDQPR